MTHWCCSRPRVGLTFNAERPIRRLPPSPVCQHRHRPPGCPVQTNAGRTLSQEGGISITTIRLRLLEADLLCWKASMELESTLS